MKRKKANRMKLIFIINIYFFYSIISCNEKNKNSKYISLNPIITEEKKDSTMEDFFIFIKDFSKSSDFQKSRIIFPLKFCSLNEEHEDTCEYVQSDDWLYIKLLDTNNIDYINVIYDNFNREFRSTNERVYAFQGIENDISNNYYFKNINHLWYLIKVEDFSY